MNQCNDGLGIGEPSSTVVQVLIIIVNDSMKKHSSTSQIMAVRERPAVSTTVPPAFDSARFVKKRKLTDKYEPSMMPSNPPAKQPLGASSALNITTPLQPKTKCFQTTGKRAKQNNPPHINKKPSQSSVGLDRKPPARTDLQSKQKNPRPSKAPLRKDQSRGFTSSRLYEQSMCSFERFSMNPSTQLRTIVETLRPEGYSFGSQSMLVINHETQQEKEDNARGIVMGVVQDMFTSQEFRVRELERENRGLKEELAKIKSCYEVLEKERDESLDFVRSRLTSREDELNDLQAATQSKECLIAELEYRLAEAQQQIESGNSAEMSELQYTVERLQTQLANYTSKLDITERQSETYKREIITIKKENAILRKQNTHYRNVLEQNQARLTEYETTIAQLQANADSQSRMAQSLEAQLIESQKQLHIPSCQVVANLKDLVAQSSSEVFRLNKQVSNLEIKLAVIERRHMEEIERLKGVHNKELRTWRERNKKLVKCNANLKQMVDERNDASIDFELNDEAA